MITNNKLSIKGLELHIPQRCGGAKQESLRPGISAVDEINQETLSQKA